MINNKKLHLMMFMAFIFFLLAVSVFALFLSPYPNAGINNFNWTNSTLIDYFKSSASFTSLNASNREGFMQMPFNYSQSVALKIPNSFYGCDVLKGVVYCSGSLAFLNVNLSTMNVSDILTFNSNLHQYRSVTLVGVDDAIYVFGGENQQGGETTLSISRYNSTNGTLLSPIQNMPTTYARLNCDNYADSIYCFGGQNSIPVMRYNISNNTAQLISSGNVNYAGGFGLVNDALYMIGGTNASGFSTFNITRYNISNNTINIIGDVENMGLSTTVFVGSAVLDGEIYLLESNTSDTKFFKYNLESNTIFPLNVSIPSFGTYDMFYNSCFGYEKQIYCFLRDISSIAHILRYTKSSNSVSIFTTEQLVEDYPYFNYDLVSDSGQNTNMTFNASFDGGASFTNATENMKSSRGIGTTMIIQASIYSPNSTVFGYLKNFSVQQLNQTIVQQPQFINLTPHSFNVSAAFEDLGVFLDIVNRSISFTSGTCNYLSNKTIGTTGINLTFNCTGVFPNSNSVVISVNDSFSNNASTTAYTNTYPNNIPLILTNDGTENRPTINNTPITTQSANVSWNFADLDNDTITNFAISWFVNGGRISTAEDSRYLTADNFTTNDSIIVGVNISDGFESSITVNSSNVTVGDGVAPLILDNFTLPTSVLRDSTVDIYVNVTDANSNIYSVSFDITNPNEEGTTIAASFDGNGSNSAGSVSRWKATFTTSVVGLHRINATVTDGSLNVQRTVQGFLNFTVNAPSSGTTTSTSGGNPTTTKTVKPNCSFIITPSILRFSEGNVLQKLNILSNEAFSITPTYNAPKTIELTGSLSSTIAPFKGIELKVIYSSVKNTNNIYDDKIVISSPQCADIVIPVKYEKESPFTQGSFLGQLKNVFTTRISENYNIGFWLVAAIIMFGVIVLLSFSTGSLKTKIGTGILLWSFLTVISYYLLIAWRV